MTTYLELAEKMAREHHAGQKDKAGDDYIHHIERVVALVGGDKQAQAVAWMHDLIEDTSVTIESLRLGGWFPSSVVEAVATLTRREAQTYAAYIDTILEARSPVTRLVKLADLIDHLRPGCPEGLRPRYEKALIALAMAGV